MDGSQAAQSVDQWVGQKEPTSEDYSAAHLADLRAHLWAEYLAVPSVDWMAVQMADWRVDQKEPSWVGQKEPS